jgi:hypothetical protein
MDGQLPADEQARVEAHLRTCQSCHDDLRTLRWTHDLLQEVVPVPVPRSFVIREADVVRARRTLLGGRPLATLQWATALVAIMLVLVVTGDVWRGAQLTPKGTQPAILSVRMQAAPDQVTLSPETDVITTIPVQSERLAQPAQTPVTPAGEAGLAQEAPIDKAIAGTTEPVFKSATDGESEGQPLPQPAEESPRISTSAPQPAEQPADAAPIVTPPPNELTHSVAGFPWMQAGWRVAEIGLGVLLVGLVVAVVWMRRRKRT